MIMRRKFNLKTGLRPRSAAAELLAGLVLVLSSCALWPCPVGVANAACVTHGAVKVGLVLEQPEHNDTLEGEWRATPLGFAADACSCRLMTRISFVV